MDDELEKGQTMGLAMKTWRIKSARLDESSNTVTLWVTSEDGFIEEYGKKAMKD